MIGPDALARLCGWLYLVASLFWIVGSALRDRTFGAEPGAFSVDNLRTSPVLARIGLIVDLAAVVGFLVTAIALYVLLVNVNQLAAGLMVVFVAIGVPVGLFALASEHAALTLATGPSAVSAAGAGSADASAALLIDLQSAARTMHELIAGLWLLPLAYLVVASGSFPRAVGVLLLVAGASWLVHLGLVVLTPQLTRLASFVVLGAIGEIVFMLWLIVRGVEIPPAG